MKKVLFYTDTPLLGGAENQMYLLAKFLPKEAYSISLACGSRQSLNPWCQKFMELGINVIRLKVLHKHDPRHFLYLKKILPEFDLLHMHLWNPASCRYGFLAGSRIPIVITEHDPFPLSGLKAFLKNKLMKRVKRIIVASEAAKKLVCGQDETLSQNISVILNGIDIEEWNKAGALSNRNEFRRIHYFATPNEKVILCVAELHPRKGQKYLIAAMAELLKKNQNVKLVFIGEGPARKHYERLALPLNGNVLFLGRRKEVPELMAAADIFVLPSVREAFGLVLLEAALKGVPIIASRVGGIPEIVEDGKTGLLVSSENPEELVAAIQKIIANPELAAKLKKNAADRVEMQFRADIMAKRTAEVYDSVL